MSAPFDTDFGPPKGSPTSEDGAAWGLASLGLGAVTLLVAPITLVFNVLLWRAGSLSSLPKAPATGGAVLGLLVMLGLACASIAFGMRGRRIDRDHRRASPLSLAGILVGVVAIFLWLIVGIDLLAILSSF
jgi:hypothetical protein